MTAVVTSLWLMHDGSLHLQEYPVELNIQPGKAGLAEDMEEG